MFRSQRGRWYGDTTSSPRGGSRRANPSVLNRTWHRLATSVSATPGPRIQAKLTVGAPNDKHEQEADRVADQVMRTTAGSRQKAVGSNGNTIQTQEKEELIQAKPFVSEITPLVQRQAEEEKKEEIQTKPFAEHITPLVHRQVEEEETLQRQPLEEEEEEPIQRQPLEEEEEEPLQRQPLEEEEETVQTKRSSKGASAISSGLASRVSSLKSGGEALPKDVRSYFEPRFGRNFNEVRIHRDAEGADTARQLNAKAYTTQNHIVFGQGQYVPNTHEGRKLLAHELTHVVQQNTGSSEARPQQRFRRQTAILKSTWPGIVQRAPGRGRQRRRGGIIITIDSRRARIDQSMGVDAITRRFYRIPIELLPPRTPIPSGPLLTIGRYGCSLRRYGLTVDDFSISYSLGDADVMSTTRPSIGGNLVECWARRVRFRLRLRQRILLPNDLATHPCLESVDPRSERAEILAHERLHEGDNNAAAAQVSRNLRTRLSFILGIGRLMAMARITDDPHAFVEECREDLHRRLEALRDEHEMMYARVSTEMAIQRDPHDEELHRTKLRLLEEARARHASSH